MKIDAATFAFKDSASPIIGILMDWSELSSKYSETPFASLPIIRMKLSFKSAS